MKTVRGQRTAAVVALCLACSLMTVPPAGAVGYDQNGQVARSGLYGTAAASSDTAVHVDPNGHLFVGVDAASNSVTLTGTASLGVVTQGASGAASQVWRTDLENPDGGTYAKVTAGKALQVDTGAASGSFPNKATLTNGDGSALSATTGPFVQQGASASLSGAWPITPIIGGSAATGANSQPVQGTVATGSAATGFPNWLGGLDTNGKMSGVTVVSTTSAGGGALSVSATLTGTGSLGTVTQGASASLPWGSSISNPDGSRPAFISAGHGLWVDLGAASSSFSVLTTPANASGTPLTTANGVKVDGSAVTQPVSGTFWQATQPVSGAVTSTQGASGSLPWKLNPTDPSGNDLTDANGIKVDVKALVALPTGANTIGAVTQAASGSLANAWPITPVVGGSLATGANSIPIQGPAASESAEVGNPLQVAGQYGGTLKTIKTASDGTVRIDPSGTTTQPVSGTFWQATQPVSGTVTSTQGASGSLPWPVVPTNTSGTALTTANGVKVDGSGVTQPVSGTVTGTQGASASLPWKANPTDASGNDLTDSNGVKVDVKALVALPTGANTIGAVTQAASGSLANAWPVTPIIGGSAATGANSIPVQGTVATASAATGFPLWLGGVDTNGKLSSVTITSTSSAGGGAFKVDGSAVTQPVSGTITAAEGASSSVPWNVSQTTPDGATDPRNWSVPHESALSLAATASTQIMTNAAHTVGFTIVPWNGLVYIGASDVTPTNGYPVPASASFTVDCFPCSGYYATGSNGVTVRLMYVTDR